MSLAKTLHFPHDSTIHAHIIATLCIVVCGGGVYAGVIGIPAVLLGWCWHGYGNGFVHVLYALPLGLPVGFLLALWKSPFIGDSGPPARLKRALYWTALLGPVCVASYVVVFGIQFVAGTAVGSRAIQTLHGYAILLASLANNPTRKYMWFLIALQLIGAVGFAVAREKISAPAEEYFTMYGHSSYGVNFGRGNRPGIIDMLTGFVRAVIMIVIGFVAAALASVLGVGLVSLLREGYSFSLSSVLGWALLLEMVIVLPFGLISAALPENTPRTEMHGNFR